MNDPAHSAASSTSTATGRLAAAEDRVEARRGEAKTRRRCLISCRGRTRAATSSRRVSFLTSTKVPMHRGVDASHESSSPALFLPVAPSFSVSFSHSRCRSRFLPRSALYAGGPRSRAALIPRLSDGRNGLEPLAPERFPRLLP